MTLPLSLGLLDFGDFGLQAMVDLCEATDARGWSRYWLAEHFESGAQASPLTLCPLLLGTTNRIKVGPAGVLLAFYNPLQVANSAALTQSFFPGRFELGLAAGGASPLVEHALTGGAFDVRSPGHFEARAEALVDLLCRRSDVPVLPSEAPPVPTWLLGSSGRRAGLAARLGVGYCLSLFHASESPEPSVLAGYRAAFGSSALVEAPLCNITVAVVCAETDAEADALSSRYRNPLVRHRIVGNAARCGDAIRAACQRFDTNEAILLLACPTRESQRHALELLADELGTPSD